MKTFLPLALPSFIIHWELFDLKFTVNAGTTKKTGWVHSFHLSTIFILYFAEIRNYEKSIKFFL